MITIILLCPHYVHSLHYPSLQAEQPSSPCQVQPRLSVQWLSDGKSTSSADNCSSQYIAVKVRVRKDQPWQAQSDSGWIMPASVTLRYNPYPGSACFAADWALHQHLVQHSIPQACDTSVASCRAAASHYTHSSAVQPVVDPSQHAAQADDCPRLTRKYC